MALPSYYALYPATKSTETGIQALKGFQFTRTPRKPADGMQVSEANQQFSDFIPGKMALSHHESNCITNIERFRL